MSYLSDLRREIGFQLSMLRSDDDPQIVGPMLDLSERLADETFAPHHRLSDCDEPSISNRGVLVLPEIVTALAAYRDLGLFGAGFAPEHGGLGLSQTVCSASFLFFAAASLATSAYPMLTVANARLLVAFGSAAQIDMFARPQIEGKWFGTMCLSEPQAGSDLGAITTRAIRDGEDGLGQRYRLCGTKMWISGAEHDAAENIVHLVLAKIVDDGGALGPGTAGISLFVVPRYLPDGRTNDVAVAGLNHKLGYRGIPNCALNFGEGHANEQPPGATGWCVGAEGQGLRQMFRMMNEARIGVSLGAAAVGYRGVRQAIDYAKERIQGRPIGTPHTYPARVAIVEHPDVLRMLVQGKAYVEGALALTLLCASLLDGPGANESLLALLTPVTKSWVSSWTLKANDLAIQVHGGYGYTRDFDVEQLWRDNRLNPIHEGTNGIQAIDLIERKILRATGEGLAELSRRIDMTVVRASEHPDLAPHGMALRGAWAMVQVAVNTFRTLSERAVLSLASPFLDAFGHVVVAWLWLEQALACVGRDDAYAKGKRQTCNAFFAIELPRVFAWLSPIREGDAFLSDLQGEHL